MFVQRGGAASNEQLSTLEILATSIGRIPRQEGYLATRLPSWHQGGFSQRSERRGKLELFENYINWQFGATRTLPSRSEENCLSPAKRENPVGAPPQRPNEKHLPALKT